jgi:hypothetical protein
MANKNSATEDSLGELHAITAEILTEQLHAFKKNRLVTLGDEGEFVKVVPLALLDKVIRFLKDNGIDQPRRAGNKMDTLAEAMPDFDAMDARH